MIVVIGILAAITIVAYNGIQDRTRAAAIQSDLANAKKKLLLYQTDNGHFPKNATELAAADLSATKTAYAVGTANNFYYCANVTTGADFAILARTVGDKAIYIITSSGGIRTVGGASADVNCQAIGLTGWTDTNAYNVTGYTGGSGNWSTWLH